MGDTVNDTLGTVTDALPDLNDTVGTVGDTLGELLTALQGTSLLDVDVNLDLALDLAAPISAAVAANANLALPIDAAVTANLLSPDAIALATADQNSLLQQTLLGDAIATTDQDSAISQGEDVGGDLVGGATRRRAISRRARRC